MKSKKAIFLRDLTTVIKKHPDSWNKPCKLPRDLDCGKYLDSRKVYRIDPVMKVIEWKENNSTHWTHFDEVYITKPTNLLGKKYIANLKEI